MAADSKTVTAPDTVSPKVFWPLVVGVGLTFVATFLAAVTPDMLSALGPFAVPAATSLVSVAAVITGWLKTDKLREIGAEATAATVPVTPTSDVVVFPDDVPADLDDEVDASGQLEAEVANLGFSHSTGSTTADPDSDLRG